MQLNPSYHYTERGYYIDESGIGHLHPEVETALQAIPRIENFHPCYRLRNRKIEVLFVSQKLFEEIKNLYLDWVFARISSYGLDKINGAITGMNREQFQQLQHTMNVSLCHVDANQLISIFELNAARAYSPSWILSHNRIDKREFYGDMKKAYAKLEEVRGEWLNGIKARLEDPKTGKRCIEIRDSILKTIHPKCTNKSFVLQCSPDEIKGMKISLLKLQRVYDNLSESSYFAVMREARIYANLIDDCLAWLGEAVALKPFYLFQQVQKRLPPEILKIIGSYMSRSTLINLPKGLVSWMSPFENQKVHMDEVRMRFYELQEQGDIPRTWQKYWN